MSDFLLPIPEKFYSDAEGEPFKQCVVCGKELLTPGTKYVVEKAIKNYKEEGVTSTIFEYAMCMDCYMEMQKGMSEESMRNLQNYYAEMMKTLNPERQMINLDEFDLNNWLSQCFFKGQPVHEMDEYELIGQFDGNQMILNTPPMVVGQQVIEEMSELISEKTRGEIDRFREQFLGPPPEIEELIFGRKLIFL